MSLVSLILVLFLIMDPVGNVQLFVKYLEGIHHKRRRFVILREMLLALFCMLFFSFLGEYIFGILGISLVTQYLASGVILFLTAIKIIFPKAQEPIAPTLLTPEPLLFPLAIPMIASPSLLATIMVYAGTEAPEMLFEAILIAWVVSVTVLLRSPLLMRWIGASGLTACERLMGMVLVLLSVQRFLEGVVLFKHNLIK